MLIWSWILNTTIQVYATEDLLKAKHELLSNTNMVDFVLKLYQEIHNTEEVPRGMPLKWRYQLAFSHWQCLEIEFAEKKEKVLAQLEEFQTQTQNIIEVIENPEVIAALRQDKLQNLHFLKENYNVSWIVDARLDIIS